MSMLTELLGLLDQVGYMPATRSQYARYLREFVDWCDARGLAQWPTPPSTISKYIRQNPKFDRRRLFALNAVHQSKRLEDNPDIAEALVVVGLLTSRCETRPIMRNAGALSEKTRLAYEGRIRRFARWCNEQRCAPSNQALSTYLDNQALQPTTRAQYDAAIRRWERLPPQADRPKFNQQPAPAIAESTESAGELRPRRRRAKPAFKLRPSESKLLFQLSRTGVAEHHRHAVGFAGIDEKRLRSMVKHRFVEAHTGVVRPHSGGGPIQVRYYTLARRGKTWVRNNFGRRGYCWNPNQINHDLHLTDVFYQLPEHVQSTWTTESELIAELQLAGRFTSGGAVDAVVMLDGASYAIEIAIGYKQADIDKKQAFINDVFDGRGLIIK